MTRALALAAAPLAALALALAAPPATPGAASRAILQDEGAAEADALLALLGGDQPVERAILTRAFDAFVERMDAFDAERAVQLGRAVFRADPAIWSVFCLEGALRRTAPATLESAGARAALAEAEAAIESLLESRLGGLGRGETIALVERLALLRAGFGQHAAERRALGASMARGGFDATQITAFAALTMPRAGNPYTASPETAGRLFASLLDRARVGPPSVAKPAEGMPWALRGFGLAALERGLR